MTAENHVEFHPFYGPTYVVPSEIFESFSERGVSPEEVRDLMRRGVTPWDVTYYQNAGLLDVESIAAVVEANIARGTVLGFLRAGISDGASIVTILNAGWDYIDVRWAADTSEEISVEMMVGCGERGIDGWSLGALWGSGLRDLDEMRTIMDAKIPPGLVPLYVEGGIAANSKTIIQADKQCEISDVHPHLLADVRERTLTTCGEELGGAILRVWCAPRYTEQILASAGENLLRWFQAIEDLNSLKAVVQLIEEHGTKVTADDVRGYLMMFASSVDPES